MRVVGLRQQHELPGHCVSAEYVCIGEGYCSREGPTPVFEHSRAAAAVGSKKESVIQSAGCAPAAAAATELASNRNETLWATHQRKAAPVVASSKSHKLKVKI